MGEYLYSSGSKDTTQKRKQIQIQPKRIQEEEPLRVFVFVNLTPPKRSTLREHAHEEGTNDDEPWSWKNPKPRGLNELQ
jgi:hypothetical protein